MGKKKARGKKFLGPAEMSTALSLQNESRKSNEGEKKRGWAGESPLWAKR